MKIKRITANIPDDLLNEAQNVTSLGITETLVLGLKLIKRRGAFEKALELRGKIKLR